jgi:molybdenum cofactor biosynthesis protein B
MSETVQEHRQAAPTRVRVAAVTVSDTRTLADDRSGQLLVELIEAAGHEVVDRQIVRDDPDEIRNLLEAYRELAASSGYADPPSKLDAVLVTGGTGIGSRDQTFETVSNLLTKAMPGYGELFRWLSFEEIGPAAMLSRAVGGVMGTLVVLTMPGSPAAVRLAMTRLIGPELGHLVREARR